MEERAATRAAPSPLASAGEWCEVLQVVAVAEGRGGGTASLPACLLAASKLSPFYDPQRINRPLSKTVRFNVLRVVPAGSGSKKGFAGF